MQKETTTTREIWMRYNLEVGIAMGAYSVLLLGALFLADGRSGPVKTVLAIIPVIPLVFVVLSAIRAYRKSDEFLQRTLAEAAAIAFGVMIIGAATLGMLGTLVGVPGQASFAVFATGMLAYMISSAVLMRGRT